MKSFVKEFLKRGAMFSVLGPIILAIVYIFLNAYGVVSGISVSKLVTEIITSAVMAFVAAGISAVNTIDKLQKPMAALIQGSVLFIDYISVYLLNGWMPFTAQAIGLFTGIFVVGFTLIWVIIYLAVRRSISNLNTELNG